MASASGAAGSHGVSIKTRVGVILPTNLSSSSKTLDKQSDPEEQTCTIEREKNYQVSNRQRNKSTAKGSRYKGLGDGQKSLILTISKRFHKRLQALQEGVVFPIVGVGNREGKGLAISAHEAVLVNAAIDINDTARCGVHGCDGRLPVSRLEHDYRKIKVWLCQWQVCAMARPAYEGILRVDGVAV